MSDAPATVAAVLAHMRLELPASLPSVDLSEAKAQTGKHVQVGVSRRYGSDESSRMTSRKGVTGWRITTRFVALSDNDARNAERLVSAALEDAVLTITDKKTTPIHFESGDAVAEDGPGYYSGLATWTFAL